jgi:hypothetical protein
MSTTYDDLKQFFGNVAGQSRLYVTLNYTGSDFTNGPNTKENPDTILGQPIWQLMNARNYSDFVDSSGTKGKQVLSKQFVEFIKTVGGVHRALDNVGTSGKITDAGKKLMESSIYSNWGNLSQDTRDFYVQNVNFVYKTERTQARDIPYPDVPAVTRMDDIRLNLKKHNSLKDGETVFGHCIPYLPNGTVLPDGDSVAYDHLHKVYKNAPTDDGHQHGGTIPGVEDWVNQGLNLDKFIDGVLKAGYKPTRDLSVRSELDGVYYDLANDEVYGRDASGVIVLKKDGKKVDDISKTTGVPESIFACILAGDSVGLSVCLSSVASSDIGETAMKEAREMNPVILDKVLKTFAVQSNGGKPEEYLQWRSNLHARLSQKMGDSKGKATADAILKNTKLCRYLQELMNIQRSNSVLHNQADNLSDLPTKTLSKSSSLAYFRTPVHINRAEALSRSLGVMAHQLNVIPQNAMQLFRPGLMAGVSFGSPFMGFGQRGGADTSVDQLVKTLRNLYDQILDDMKKQGKDLVQEDKDRIEKALIQIQKNNKLIMDALQDLQTFVRLDESLKHGLSTVSLKDIEGSRRIKGVSKSVGKLEDCVQRTSREQVALLTALIEQVYRPMLHVSSGISGNPFLRPI